MARYFWLIPLLPGASALVLLLLGPKLSRRWVSRQACLSVFLSFALSVVGFVHLIGAGHGSGGLAKTLLPWMVAYEWSGTPNAANLHRNVIFRNTNVPALPISYIEEPTREGLWAELQMQCLDAGTGCDVLAIPHNSNLSNGLHVRGRQVRRQSAQCHRRRHPRRLRTAGRGVPAQG